jgi:hypothetical protein
MRRRRLFLILGAVVLLAGAGVFLYDCIGIMWVGSFPLTVNLDLAEPNRVSRVWAAAAYRREWAEEVLYGFDPERPAYPLREVADFRRPFIVDVVCTGSTSGLGRERSYEYYRALVLLIEYADGRRAPIVVDTPDGRPVREITLPIP